MNLICAGVLGFCMGVRRAVELAAEAGRDSSRRVFTLGPLIHNPKVLADLQNSGVETLDELPANCENCTVIIRAHGVSPDVEKRLSSSGCRIIDATCPRVKASQLKVEELSLAGYFLFLAGEAEHAEIEGIMGYAGSAPFCAVVGGADEAEQAAARLYEKNKDAKTALLGQTTISRAEYSSIGGTLKKYFPDLKIVDTICAATTDRQNALHELLDKVDAVIIAGGKESANTRRLLAIAQESGKPCVLAESPSCIPDYFKTFQTVGISAGASTPDSVISEIELELLSSNS